MLKKIIPLFFLWPILTSAEDNLLGWVTTDDPHNRCGGYYMDTPQLDSQASSIGTSETTIIAKKSTLFSQTGISTLEGDVRFSQPGRQITADKASLTRDKKSGAIKSIQLEGKVRASEIGKLLVSKKIDVDLANNHMRFENILYRINKTLKAGAQGTAWGEADFLEQDKQGVFNFSKATYSTCSPLNRLWHLKASKMQLNTKSGRGDAFHSLLYLGNQPIFYFPFFEFPLDDRRKSGFLLPTFNYSNQSGWDVTAPFYWNVAPNKDVVLSSRFITKRGAMLSATPRYLDQHTNASANINFLFDDYLFHNFRQSSLISFAATPTAQHGLSRLQSAKDSRFIITAGEQTVFNSHWSTATNVNYASDDYVFLDLDNILGLDDTVHLPNQASLHYDSDFWHLQGRVQAYQNLHPVTEILVPDLYNRLPQFNVVGFAPYSGNGFISQVNAEFVHFAHRPDFVTHLPVVTGDRLHINPEVSLPLRTEAAFLTPKVQLDMTAYQLVDQNLGQPDSVNRVQPIFDIDSGLFFDRDLVLHGQGYRQTLEPRLFYLYAPKRDQQNIPIFDTVLPPFDFPQLFRTNRFSSYDRFGDANQISLAFSSRILDAYNGEEQLRLSLGEIYYIDPYEVCIKPDCQDDGGAKNPISPLIGEMQFAIIHDWNVKASLAWDPKRFQTKNAYASLLYQREGQALGSLGYSFVRDGDVLAEKVLGDLEQINMGVAWPLTMKWNLLGNWNYNLSWHQPQTYYYGVEYNGCCLAFRAIANRRFTGVHANIAPQFERKFYFQVQFKGLSNIGNNNPGNLLAQTIPGYHDNFGG